METILFSMGGSHWFCNGGVSMIGSNIGVADWTKTVLRVNCLVYIYRLAKKEKNRRRWFKDKKTYKIQKEKEAYPRKRKKNHYNYFLDVLGKN